MQNERTRTSRIRGYLEWFWCNTEEGKINHARTAGND
eukprot:UN11625